MSGFRKSTLPTVLKEYSPESKPNSPQQEKINASNKPKDVQKHQCHTHKHKNVAKEKTGRKKSGDHGDGSTSSQSGRNRRKLEADAERFESLSSTWEVAVSEVRQERHQQLQEKLQLQHQLLHLQHELSQAHRTRDRQRQDQQKENERSKKIAQRAALEEVCKKSLAEDRKAMLTQRKDKKEAPPQPKDVIAEVEGQNLDAGAQKSNPSTPELQRTRRPRYVSKSPTLPASPMREMEYEDDDEMDEELSLSTSSSDFDSLPWHHQQLYRLYGNEADYFLHPKIEPKTEVVVAPKIKKSTGHVGAEKLWTLLRGESRAKLLKEDGRFPHELKDAYSAFVRESLNLGRVPVDRNFTATEDVPDMQKLLDKSLLRNIRKFRHKTGIMYRSSKTNHNRTDILLFNNPLPDITDGDGVTIARYMPSWMGDGPVPNYDDEDQPAYAKWLTEKKKTTLEEQDSEIDATPRQDLDEKTVHEPQQQTTRQKSRLHFLTEREASTKGNFVKRFYESQQRKDLPKAHIKPQSSMGFRDTQEDCEDSPRGPVRSVSVASQDDFRRRYTSSWQPLSMNALVEYKEQLDSKGIGEFQHGRMTMWNTISSPSA